MLGVVEEEEVERMVLVGVEPKAWAVAWMMDLQEAQVEEEAEEVLVEEQGEAEVPTLHFLQLILLDIYKYNTLSPIKR